MYIMTKIEELAGKKIVYAHNNWDNEMVLVTEDKYFICIQGTNDWDGNAEVVVAKDYSIFEDMNVRKDLQELGILTVEEIIEYDEAKKERDHNIAKQIQQQRVERERKEFERLKAKFGD